MLIGQTDDRWFNYDEAAEYLGLSSNTIRRYASSSIDPYYQLKKYRRGIRGETVFKQSDLDELQRKRHEEIR